MTAQQQKRSRKWLWLPGILMLPPLLCIACLAFLLSYDAASRVICEWVDSQDWGVSLAYQQGDLWNGIDFNSMGWADESVSVQASQAFIDIDYSCFLQARLCLSTVRGDRLSVTIDSADNDQGDELPIDASSSEPLPEVALPLVLAIQALQIETLTLNISGSETVIDHLQAAALFGGTQLRIFEVSGEYQDIMVQGEADLRFVDAYPLNVSLGLDSDALELQARVIAKGDLNHLRVDAHNSGRWPLSVKAKLSDLLTELAFDATLKTLQTLEFDSADSVIELPPSALHVVGGIDAGVIQANIENIQLHIPAITDQVASAGSFVSAKLGLAATWEGRNLSIQQLLLDTSAGKLDSAGELQWLAEDILQWQLVAQLEGLNAAGWTGDKRLQSQLSAHLDTEGHLPLESAMDGLNASLRISEGGGMLADKPITFSADIKHSPEVLLDVEALKLSSQSNTLNAHGELSATNPLQIDWAFDDLSQLVGQVSGDLSGQASIQLLGKQLTDLTLKGRAQSEQLSMAGLATQAAILELDIRNFASADSQLRFSLDQLEMESQTFTDIELQLNGQQLAHTLATDMQLEGVGEMALRCRGGFKTLYGDNTHLPWQGRWDGECDSLQADDLLETLPMVHLQQAVAITWEEHVDTLKSWQFLFNPFCLQIGSNAQAALCSHQAISVTSDGIFNIDIKALELPLSVLGSLLNKQLKLEGDVQLLLQGHWPFTTGKQLAASLQGESLAGSWRYVVEEEPEPSQQDDGLKDEPQETVYSDYHFDIENFRVVVALDDAKATVDAGYRSPQLGEVAAAIQVNDVQQAKTLSGEIEIKAVNLAPIAEFSHDLASTAGVIDGSIKLSGSLSAPAVNGHVALVDGAIRPTFIKNRINNVQMDLNFDLDKAALNGRIDIDGEQLKTTGTLDWRGGDWQATLQLLGESIPFYYGPVERAQLTPDINVVIEQDLLNISGSLALSDTLVELKALPATAQSESDDVVYVHSTASDLDAKERQGDMDNTGNMDGADAYMSDQSDWKMQADLLLVLNDDVRFRGFGADVLLSGDLHYLQQGRRFPMGRGEIKIDEGSYTFWGQRLEITEGSFLFTGLIDNPDIKIEAIREIESESLTVGIRGSGPIEEPVFDVFSSRPMNNQEAMHYLLTGRAMDAKAAEGTDLLSTALLSKGVSNAEGRTSKFFNKFGISDFQMSTASGEAGTEVQLSGYIREDIFVRYGMGLFDSANTFTVRYQLMPNLFVETASGLDSTVDLIYSFEWLEKE